MYSVSDQPDMLIIPAPYGQLGNRLQTFAHILSFVLEHDLAVAHFGFDEYAPYFRGTSQGRFVGFGLSGIRGPLKCVLGHPEIASWALRLRLGGRINVGWDKSFDLQSSEAQYLVDRCRRNRVTYLIGYRFLAPGLLAKYRKTIRDYFAPLDEFTRTARDGVEQVRSEFDTLIGVHVRHGDYQTFRNGLMYYSAADYADYMRRAMGLFSSQRLGFMVCTDGDLRPDDFPGLPVVFGPGDLIGDLFTLSCCDYLIAAPSTFSVWASFYGCVPLYLVNRKYCEMYGCEEEPLALSSFKVREPR